MISQLQEKSSSWTSEVADMLHIVQAIKKSQCGLNIFPQPGFLPFHTSPDSVTSSLFYSTAPPLLLHISPFHVVCSFHNHIPLLPTC